MPMHELLSCFDWASLMLTIAACRAHAVQLKVSASGHFATDGVLLSAQLKEVKEEYVPGQQLNVDDMFKAGDLVDIAGKTIGKGFQGGSAARPCACAR